MKKPVWDLFCEVIDNWGDAGICWRLAQQLHQRNIHVRLWIDDPTPLSWMSNATSTHHIEIIHWQKPLNEFTTAALQKPGAVFIEAFGCHAPEPYLHQVSQQATPPVWINLEYLSAQNYAERLHGLPSLQHTGPAKGLTRWFYYPGFTPQTGGLLKESDIFSQQQKFSADTWLHQMNIPHIPQAMRISLFSYPNQALPGLLKQWEKSSTPIHLLATPGHTSTQLRAIYNNHSPASTQTAQTTATSSHGQISITYLPYLSQKDYDHLLWSCDLNFVRGEDSWIRAIWAQKPFIWQPYIQDDDEHFNKLNAFTQCITKLSASPPPAWLKFQQNWTNQHTPDWQALYGTLPATNQCLQDFSLQLSKQTDLVTSLINFVQNKTYS